MYSDKKIVNMLTSFLIAKGIRKAVVCPGSRNIPIVNNLFETEDIQCFPVTDERSAGFYALGLSLCTKEPVVVCVTSGSALLNVSPAIAEAYYRHVPIVLISADRPEEWIDRLDGQTMHQYDVMKNFIKAQVDLSEITDDDRQKENFFSLSLNKCLNKAIGSAPGPVHINVHLDEPLFNFNVGCLQKITNIKAVGSSAGICLEVKEVIRKFISADKKLILIGQLPYADRQLDVVVRELSKYFVVLTEPLSSAYSVPFDNALPYVEISLPDRGIDVLLTLGNNFVSKQIRQYIRSCDVSEHWEINAAGEIHDVSMHQTGVVARSEIMFLEELLKETKAYCSDGQDVKSRYDITWNDAIRRTQLAIDDYVPAFSQLSVVKDFELSLEDMEYDYDVHYANSMSVRLGCIYSQHYIWCNRGMNGIEGSVSTAAGFSLATDKMVFCVVGDLSFFYDQNALWNNNLRGNLRILLLNNDGGGIFSRLKGLDSSIGSSDYIFGVHKTNARGICEQNDVGYISASSNDEYREALVHFLTEATSRPMVLEVFTSIEEDNRVLDELNKEIKNIK